MLLRHLIPYNYRTIRYCGFYRKKHKNHDKMVIMVNQVHHTIMKQMQSLRMSILRYFNRDPYSCTKCNTVMKYACEIIKGG